MTLNLNISNFGTGAAVQAHEAAQTQQTAKDAGAVASRSDSYGGFSITQGTATPEDIAAAAISDAALRRDDPLGNLIKSAFNLPPPPPPWEAL